MVSKTVCVRIPDEMLSDIQEGADDLGLPLGTYIKVLLNKVLYDESDNEEGAAPDPQDSKEAVQS